MGYEKTINAVMDSSYLSKPVEELREMLGECMDIHGSNPSALHRITHAAELIREELASRFMSGEATWLGLKRAVEDLLCQAPQDHDVIIQVGDVSVRNAEFIKPHTFLFEGVNQSGHRTWIVVHFSKLDARVVYLPKRGPERVITGFADGRVA